MYERVLEEINLYGPNGLQIAGPKPLSLGEAQDKLRQLEEQGLPVKGLVKNIDKQPSPAT